MDYYLYGGIALGAIIVAIVLILLLKRRRENESYSPDDSRHYRRRSKSVIETIEGDIDSGNEPGDVEMSNNEFSNRLGDLMLRTEALETYVYGLGEEFESRLDEFAEYMAQKEARTEEVLGRLQAMLEERLPATAEYSRFLQTPSDEPRSKPLRSIDTGKFLNEAAPVKLQPRNANSEKNSKVRRLHRQGYSIPQIAQELGISVGEVKLIIELDASASKM